MKRVFRNPFRRDRWRDDLDEELAFHVEARTRALMANGLTETEARAEARRRLGDVERIRAEMGALQGRSRRRRRLADGIDATVGDVRLALRMLARRPVATGLTLLTLALGIGATTAVFSVTESVLWDPFPFTDPDRVVVVDAVEPDRGWSSGFGPAVLPWWRDDAPSFRGLAGFAPSPLTLTGFQDPIRLPAWQVTHGFFDLLGVPLLLGRGFTAGEDQPGAPASVVLSHGLWRDRFGGDPEILGRTVEVEGAPARVVGVSPPSLDFSAEMPAFYLPLRLPEDQWSNPGGGWLNVVGRLAPDADPDAAARDLTGVLVAQGVLDPSAPEARIRVRGLDARFTDPARLPLFLLLGTVVLVLLVGCANIANLTVAQAVGRTREVAVRAALGAGRGRVARMFLAESLLLGGMGALLGILVAAGLIPWLVRLAPPELPRIASAGIDGSVLAFAAGTAMGTALLFGLTPSLVAGRTDIRSTLGQGGRGLESRGTGRIRTGLVALQAALCVVLLTTSGLLLRTVDALGSVETGFDRSVITARVALRGDRYPAVEDAVRTFREIRDELSLAPEIEAAAYTSRAPFFGSGFGLPVARTDGAGELPPVDASLRIASAGYFATAGMPMSAGRELVPSDDVPGGEAVVVNGTLARALGWREPGDALGGQLEARGSDFRDGAGRPRLWRIVGVVADSRTESLRSAPVPEAFFPPAAIPSATWSWIDRELVLAVRPRSEGAAPAMRRVVSRIDPGLPLQDIRSLGDRVADSLATERMLTLLTSGLGLLALALSALGIFGVVAYAVAARVREIGLRMALGSTATQVRALVVGAALRPVLAGGVLGLGIALAAGRALEPVLFRVRPWDPAVLAGTAGVLVGIAVVASWLPARRASRVDPARVLAGE